MSQTDCNKMLDLLEVYLDGELEGPERAHIEAHLGECGPCMDRSDFQQRLRALLKEKCGCDEVPPDLMERVRNLLGETPTEPVS